MIELDHSMFKSATRAADLAQAFIATDSSIEVSYAGGVVIFKHEDFGTSCLIRTVPDKYPDLPQKTSATRAKI